MDALILTSRKVCKHKCISKDFQKKHDQHLRKIDEIKTQKNLHNSSRSANKKTRKSLSSLSKVKQKAANFRRTESQIVIFRENKLLLDKMIKIGDRKKERSPKKEQYQGGGSNSKLKQKLQQTIEQDNKRLKSYRKEHAFDQKNYKKKMKEQIKKYLQLRQLASKHPNGYRAEKRFAFLDFRP